jgi:accessory gene regulator protein AgrB
MAKTKRRTYNAMGKTKEEQTIQWPKQKKNRQYNASFVLIIVLSVLLFLWPLLGHCIVCSSFVLPIALYVLLFVLAMTVIWS